MSLIWNINIPLCCVLSAAILLAGPSVMAAPAVPFTVNMSENVTVNTTGGTPRLQLDVGGVTRYAAYTSGSGSAALTFTYDTQPGDVDLDGVTLSSPLQLNGGTIVDAGGNALSPLTFTVPPTSGVRVDHPSLAMDFTTNTYSLSGTQYNTLSSFLTAGGGSFTRASTATYYDSSGTLQSAASGTPRFDYDPVTHAAKGLLIEESRTNGFTYSEQIENAVWGKTQATVTTNSTLAPDDTMTADTLTADGTNNPHYIFRFTSLANNTDYAVSFFVKRNTANYVSFSVTGTANISIRLDLNDGTLTTQSVGAATVYNTSVTQAKNGFYRFNVGFRQTSGSPQDMRLYIYNSTPTEASTASVYFWGLQREDGRVPTSYIPAVGSAATRQADVLSVPAGAWYNAATGTLTGRGSIPVLGGNANPRLASLYSNSNNGIELHVTDAGADRKSSEIWVGGSRVFLYNGGVYSAPSVFNIGIAYELNNSVAAAEGALGTVNTSVAIPAVSVLGAGIARGGTLDKLNGHLQRVRYYPARVAGPQLQLLTQ